MQWNLKQKNVTFTTLVTAHFSIRLQKLVSIFHNTKDCILGCYHQHIPHYGSVHRNTDGLQIPNWPSVFR